MSRTTRDCGPKPRPAAGGRARGISPLKRKFQRSNRRRQDEQMRKDDSVIDPPKRLRNFWWEWF